MESISFEDIVYHKACLKCSHCNGRVNLSNLAKLDGRIYCQVHFLELFRLRGSYNDFAADQESNVPAFGVRRKSSAVPTNMQRASVHTADSSPGSPTPILNANSLKQLILCGNEEELKNFLVIKSNLPQVFKREGQAHSYIEWAFQQGRLSEARLMINSLQVLTNNAS